MEQKYDMAGKEKTVCAASAETESPVAETDCGKVKGEIREGISIFRGIPYGDDCTGSRRFQAPRPAVNWEGVRDCTRNGFYAPQFGCSISGSRELGEYFSGGHPEKFGVAGEEQNENCLVLNVVTPGCDDKRRPVVVYIHGGGFSTGSGTLVLGADRWVREEDLVIVGVNHRLNLFGYLYLGELDPKYADSGAAGMLDLILALKWVQKNIGNFGGDPERVTIMGESGGGAKVSTLLAMKEAGDLFRAAIVESGSMPVGCRSREEGTLQALKLLEKLGIPGDRPGLLEDKTTEELLWAMKESGNMGAMEFQPVADGIHIEAGQGYTAPEGAENIPLLVGASEDELAIFLEPELLENMTWENMDKSLAEITIEEPLYQINREDWGRIISRFRELDKDQSSPAHLFAKICSQASMLGGGAYYQAMKKAGQKAAVYSYIVSCDSPHPGIEGQRYSWHTADLPLQMRIVLYPDSEELSRKMAHAWAAFIRDGVPSAEGLEWKPFTQEEKWTMVIGEQWKMEKDPLREMRMCLEV
ncbi:carboxylesterase/lipase family protein [Murimonas intestini]|uniref:Carboxylic ester hydrolase n=1 Tax=Murimonas intestini TaxID=1337051 RepID=A0AB73SZB6_9FIRM|nr:carboxylesterase family protein [Murimonas intestini]MCR1842831.1 carboxylesterase family protein [Murimonas intestini]MCR1867830.1 carboxylesterase family protein [Murimonas intestini]MCR1885181.1 carboxylesterase family protein [Murimonas intestini]